MNFKKILITTSLATLLSSLSTTSNSADKIGVTQDLGILITGYYKYDEPDFMYNKSEVQDHLLNNFGIMYNAKNNFLFEGYLNQLEFDADFRRFDINYWSNGTGTVKNVENDVYNLRALYGIQASDKLMFKTGYGYRHLIDKKKGVTTTTGGVGYDRIQEYEYIPFIVEANMPVAGVNGKLKLEYDYFVYGFNQNEFVNSASNVNMRNDDGYSMKVSYKFPYSGINIEPYYEYMNVEKSKTVSGSTEPHNTTTEFGVKISKTFGEQELKSVPSGKRLFNNEKIYLGADILKVNLDTGLSNGSANVKIDEDSYGYSLTAGYEINKNLDLEISYNDFGKAELSASTSGSTFKTDGRVQNRSYSSGSTLTTTQNNVSINFRSNSTGVALKPKADLGNGVSINGLVGYANYLQSEQTVYPNAGNNQTMHSYEGKDWFYGVGVGAKVSNNLDLSLNYKKYEMYYDAEVLSASVRYIF
jgi:OmpA-like transmembrane domain